MSALVAALGATLAVAGCAEEAVTPPITPEIYAEMADAELQMVGAPGLADRPFGEALVTFSHGVHRIHAFAGAREDAAIHDAVRALATLLDRMPAGADEPALRRAAAAIRANEASRQSAAPEPEIPDVELTKRSLATAATALLHLASGQYRENPEVAAEARAFAAAVGAIDSERVPPDRAAVLAALIRAERVLAAIYAVNVAPPAAAPPRSAPP